MPAKFLIDARMVLVSNEGLAYSFKYIAQATPKGTANRVVIKVRITVPTKAGKIPPLVIPSVGNVETKFQDKLLKPFENISHIITPKNAHTNKVLPHRVSQLQVFNSFFRFIMREIFVADSQNIHLSN